MVVLQEEYVVPGQLLGDMLLFLLLLFLLFRTLQRLLCFRLLDLCLLFHLRLLSFLFFHQLSGLLFCFVELLCDQGASSLEDPIPPLYSL